MPKTIQYDPTIDEDLKKWAFRVALRKLRQEASLTQQALADMLGKPQSYVSKCEVGTRRLGFIEALNVAEHCGYSGDMLCTLYETTLEESE